MRGFLFGVVDGYAVVFLRSLAWDGGEFHVQDEVFVRSGGVHDHAAIGVLGERNADRGC